MTDVKKNPFAKLIISTPFVADTVPTCSGKASHFTTAAAVEGHCLVGSSRHHRIHRKSRGNVKKTCIPVFHDGTSSCFDSGHVTFTLSINSVRGRCPSRCPHYQEPCPWPFLPWWHSIKRASGVSAQRMRGRGACPSVPSCSLSGFVPWASIPKPFQIFPSWDTSYHHMRDMMQLNWGTTKIHPHKLILRAKRNHEVIYIRYPILECITNHTAY